MQADDGGEFQFPDEPQGSPGERSDVVKTIRRTVGGNNGLGERTVVLESPPDSDRDLGDLGVDTRSSMSFFEELNANYRVPTK
jgi:hypothetical protein